MKLTAKERKMLEMKGWITMKGLEEEDDPLVNECFVKTFDEVEFTLVKSNKLVRILCEEGPNGLDWMMTKRGKECNWVLYCDDGAIWLCKDLPNAFWYVEEEMMKYN